MTTPTDNSEKQPTANAQSDAFTNAIPFKRVYFLYALLAFLLLLLAASGCRGIYTVSPGEAAALQTFGAARYAPVTAEGFHWHWPPPIGRATVVQVQKSRTATVGFHYLPEGKIDLVTGEDWNRDTESATMITGDLNLVEIQFTAQYHITDLNRYLFAADDPGYRFQYADGDKVREHRSHQEGYPDGQSIRDALEIAVRRAVGHRTIDQALVSEREVIELETMNNAQQILDGYETGLTITSIQLQEVKAPDAVQDAFDDVLRAREERDTRINEALSFESRVLPEARGDAERLRREAEAYRAQKITAAEGESDRFQQILDEYRAAPDIIKTQIYLETMERILPRTRQIIIGADQPPALIINTDPNSQIVPVITPQE